MEHYNINQSKEYSNIPAIFYSYYFFCNEVCSNIKSISKQTCHVDKQEKE